MALTVQDIMDTMEAWAPAAYAYSWDKVGLCIGDPKAKVTKVVTCLTVDHKVVQVAKRAKAEMIVSHHPLIWEALTVLRTDDSHTKLCLELAEAGIACFSAHTNLDVAPDGVNDLLATQLGLEQGKPLFPAPHAQQLKVITYVPESHLAPLRAALWKAGAGGIGKYSRCSFSSSGTGTFMPAATADPYVGTQGKLHEEPERRLEVLVDKAVLGAVVEALHKGHPYEEAAFDVIPLENTNPLIGLGVQGVLKKEMKAKKFAEHVRNALELVHVRMVGNPDAMVTTVAVMGGAGGSEIGNVPAGVDAFVTGDVKYHDALEAVDRGLVVIDAGHCGTERGIAEHIAKHLKSTHKQLTCKAVLEEEVFQVIEG